MGKVVKRDGRIQQFMPEKIVVSVLKVGVPLNVARKIAKEVQSKVKEKASTAEIRKLVLKELHKRKPVWEQDWYIYERVVKKRKK